MTGLESVADVLAAGGFTVEIGPVDALDRGLLAETSHALVLGLETKWDEAAAAVEEAQAVLTSLAGRSPRGWDLYVVAVIETQADDGQELIRERLEHDTRYARKFILAGPAVADDAALARALLPLLPLRPVEDVRLDDPLLAVRRELLAAGGDARVIEAALRSFEATGEVALS